MTPLSDIIEKAKRVASLDPSAERQWTCERCDGPTGGPYALCQPCVLAANQERREARMAQARACIPESFATFAPPADDKRRRNAGRISNGLANGMGALLCGPAGSGKTTTTVIAIRHVLDTFDFEVASRIAWTSAYDLAKAPQEHRLGAQEAPLVRQAKEASILVLDELGSEQAKTTAVQEAIHERHIQGRPTIVTTWLDMPGIQERYGDGIARRLLERSLVIAFGNGGAK